jgi:hypothetical protein
VAADSLREDFEEWLADMQTGLDRFTDALPEEVADALDESPESLDVLEAWLLERYPSTEAVLEESEKEILDGAARYVGETFLGQLGGKWSISADDPKDVNYQLPILTGFRGQFSTLAPVTMVTAAADRRTGTYLSTILRNIQRRAAEGAVPPR